jgi:hypothetical protein
MPLLLVLYRRFAQPDRPDRLPSYLAGNDSAVIRRRISSKRSRLPGHLAKDDISRSGHRRTEGGVGFIHGPSKSVSASEAHAGSPKG